MATHGTDQDMVQRMLTAKNHQRSRLALVLSGLADLPIVFAFLTAGILLYAFYQVHPDPHLPAKNIFAYWILHELPGGLRGLLVAGVLATAMGSLSTALNALATSFVQDWWMPLVNREATEKMRVRAVRWSTVVFGVLLVLIGGFTARTVVVDPNARIIPIVLGVFGYTYGSLLGVFLLGILTKNRGNDLGNITAMAGGFVVVAWLSDLSNDLMTVFNLRPFPHPAWMPVIAFPWRVFFGAVTTLFIAALFPGKQSD
jgi:Na+/proline symporter